MRFGGGGGERNGGRGFRDGHRRLDPRARRVLRRRWFENDALVWFPSRAFIPIEPEHLDTVGPMGKDIAHTVQGMDLLQSGFAALYAAAVAAKPSAREIRIGRLKLKGTDREIDRAVDEALAKAGFQVVPLDDELPGGVGAGQEDGNTIAAAGAWISDKQYPFRAGRVAARTKSAIRAGQIAYATGYEAAVARQAEWQNTLQSDLQESGLHRAADHADDAAADSAEFENRRHGSAHARTAKHGGGEFRGQPGAGAAEFRCRDCR